LNCAERTLSKEENTEYNEKDDRNIASKLEL